MSITVEHDKRKHEILTKAFEVFLEVGYANATFQKIADRCGITRTTLYIYFKNKQEIFLFSIKQLTEELEKHLYKILNDDSLSAVQCLTSVLELLMDAIEENQQLFRVLLPYLMQMRQEGHDPKRLVTRRILNLRHIFSTIIIRGQKAGEFKKISVHEINELIYDLIEAAVFRIVIFAENNVKDVRGTIKLVIDAICR